MSEHPWDKWGKRFFEIGCAIDELEKEIIKKTSTLRKLHDEFYKKFIKWFSDNEG